MGPNANVKTQYQAYQLARLVKELSETEIKKENNELQSHMDQQMDYRDSLSLDHSIDVIRNSNVKIHAALGEECKIISDLLKVQRAKEGPAEDACRDAIAETLETLSHDEVYPHNSMMFFAGPNKDEFEQAGYKEIIEETLHEFFDLKGLKDEAFHTSQSDDNIGETLIQVNFSGFPKAREAIFDAIQKLAGVHGEHLYAVNGLGVNLSVASANNIDYERAVHSENKSLTESLYQDRAIVFSPNIDEFIANNDDKFEKTYQKWESTEFESSSNEFDGVIF
jgi:hypothetical protein